MTQEPDDTQPPTAEPDAAPAEAFDEETTPLGSSGWVPPTPVPPAPVPPAPAPPATATPAGEQAGHEPAAVAPAPGAPHVGQPQPPASQPVDHQSWDATQPYAHPPATALLPQPAPAPAPRRGVPAWTWPAVVGLSLVVGVLGGSLGSELQDRWSTGSFGLQPSTTRTAPPLKEGNTSVAAVAAELLPSTVQVLVRGGSESGTGSGFVLDDQGHVVTNNHVVAAAAQGRSGRMEVVDHRGRSYEAELVGSSRVYDIAVIKVEGVDLRPAALGSSADLLVGEPVVAFGAPLGLSQTVTAGIVSALNRPVTTGSSSDESSFINAVQTDAAINPGNSGGPLVDLDGRVVGVNSAIATTGGLLGESGNIGVGFAIPIEQVKVTADQILRTGEARYPVIGATVQTAPDPERRGALIEEVNSGSPSARAGLRKGDVVVAVDGTRILDGISLIVQIRTHQPGERIELTVERDGEERTFEVILDSQVG